MSDLAGNGGSVSTAEVAVWFGVVTVLTLFVHPFLGVVAALALDHTCLRHSPTAVRLGLLAVALAILALELVGLSGAQMSGTTGPAIPITG